MDKAVAKYFSKASKEDVLEYERVKEIVLSIVPEAKETISYAIPTLKLGKDGVMGFGVNKNHLSLYPFSGQVIEENREILKAFSLSKGTVRYSREKPVPKTIIKKLVRSRLNQIATHPNSQRQASHQG